VYVVDRPGHGRSPWHPDLHGPFPPPGRHAGSDFWQVHAAEPDHDQQSRDPYQHLHTQWPGTGEVGSRDLDQFVASQGGA